MNFMNYYIIKKLKYKVETKNQNADIGAWVYHKYI